MLSWFNKKELETTTIAPPTHVVKVFKPDAQLNTDQTARLAMYTTYSRMVLNLRGIGVKAKRMFVALEDFVDFPESAFDDGKLILIDGYFTLVLDNG